MFDTFYNESLRKTVVAFGSLFDEIYVQRRDSDGNTTKKILVPITYSPKEKFMRMLDEYPLLKGEDSNVHIGQVLPRMGFNITSINYDPTRKRNTISKRYGATDTTGVFERQFAEVPYTVNFSLAIVTRTMDDALQIVERCSMMVTQPHNGRLFSIWTLQHCLTFFHLSKHKSTLQQQISQTFLHFLKMMDQSQVQLVRHPELFQASRDRPAQTRCPLLLV